jgi:hypothetical protein
MNKFATSRTGHGSAISEGERPAMVATANSATPDVSDKKALSLTGRGLCKRNEV